MKRLSSNRALSRSLYEENGLQKLYESLGDLFFSKDPIDKRIDRFMNLRGIKVVTMSHFLCFFDPQKYPYVATETFNMLELDENQERAARSQALHEHSISGSENYHSSTIEYLTRWVVFRAVKDYLGLESYPLLNIILWKAFVYEGEPEGQKPRSKRENLLYRPIADALIAQGKGYFWVKVTANLNREGQWSRPDITKVEVDLFDYLPEKYVQVTSYEVKSKDAYDISSVYEAVAHQRFAHQTYLVLEVDDEDDEIDEEVRDEAVRLGVGIMKAYSKGEDKKIELVKVEDPQMKHPSPEELDDFIDAFFGDDEEARKYKHVIGK
ncbi:MAG: hypothetical protein QXG05_07360 [Nitrososphaerota archaeon]